MSENTAVPPGDGVEERGWVVRQEWHQVFGDGIYEWQLWGFVESEPARLVTGFAATRVGVRWQVWRALWRLGYEKSWRAFTKRGGPTLDAVLRSASGEER